MKGRLLVVTAVPAEAAACPTMPGMDVLVGGVGPAAAAASTAYALAGQRYDAVLCAGIAGGFPPAEVGHLVLADEVVFADLGAETPAGFAPLSALGFADERSVAGLRAELARHIDARAGVILTVATVTGTAATAAARHARYPGAVAEAMEGAGVARAAEVAEIPFGELRAISNLVGPRDRAAWRIPEAIAALGAAIGALAGADWTS